MVAEDLYLSPDLYIHSDLSVEVLLTTQKVSKKTIAVTYSSLLSREFQLIIVKSIRFQIQLQIPIPKMSKLFSMDFKKITFTTLLVA